MAGFRRRRVSQGAVALLILSLVAAACGGNTPGPTGATSDPGAGPTDGGATDGGATSAPGGSASPSSLVHAQLAPEDAAAWEDALIDGFVGTSGVEAALGDGGWGLVEGALRTAVADALDKANVARGPGLVASTSSDVPLTAAGAGVAGIGVVMAGSLISSGLSNPSGAGSNLNVNLDSTSERTANGQRTVTHMTGRIATSSGNGRVSGTVSITADVQIFDAATGQSLGSVSFNISGTVEMDLCPDASGNVKGHVSMALGGAGAQGSGQLTVDADVIGTVNDDAYLAAIDASGATSETTTSPSGATRSSTVSAGYGGPVQSSGTFDPNAMSAHGQVDAETGEPLTSEEVTQRYERVGGATGLALWMLSSEAQKQWRNGACVEIHATEHDRNVRPRQHVQFEAKPFHKIEQRDLQKPIVATFTGEASADPLDVPVPPVALFDYVASPTKDHSGTISLTSTSNRGIGKLSITFTTKVTGWMVDQASGGGRIQGQHCGDPPGDWVVDGTYDMGGMQGRQQWTISIDASGTGGTYTYFQVSQGRPSAPGVGTSPVTVTVRGDASGTVTLTIDQDSHVHMHFKEQRHTYRAKAGRAWGKATPLPLEEGDMEWEPDPSC